MEIKSTQPNQIAFRSLFIDHESVEKADVRLQEGLNIAQMPGKKNKLSPIGRVAETSNVYISSPEKDSFSLRVRVGIGEARCEDFNISKYKTAKGVTPALVGKLENLTKIARRQARGLACIY